MKEAHEKNHEEDGGRSQSSFHSGESA